MNAQDPYRTLFTLSSSHPDYAENTNRAKYLISRAIRDGKISRKLLTSLLAFELSNTTCWKCDAAVQEAKQNNITSDPRVDSLHHTVCGIRLTPIPWKIFNYMFHHGFITMNIVEKCEYLRTTPLTRTHALRNYIYTLRRLLRNTDFTIIATRTGGDTEYTLRKRCHKS